MKVLAIDSSGLTATVAIVDEIQTVAEYTVNYKKTHSQTLLPMINEIVKMVELDLKEIDAIAVAGGPGSFTGLRIGSATAKGLGLALGKPLVSVPTVDGLAYGAFGCSDIICPMMDARRNQVYTGLYTFSKKAGEKSGQNLVEPAFQVIKMQMAISVEELIARLNRYGRPVLFLGDGVPVYAEMLAAGLKVPYSLAPSYMNRQRAAIIGALGIRYYKAGKYETAAEHKPEYLRVSQAERERAKREKNARLVIRELKKEEAAAASEIERQTFPDAWSEKGILETMENPNTICLAAEKGRKLLGYLFVYFAAGEAEIARVAVIEEAQRQGVARQMMKELERICKSRKIGKLMLDVREGNETAKKFYEAAGFAFDGKRQGFYENPTEDAVLMSKKISFWEN